MSKKYELTIGIEVPNWGNWITLDDDGDLVVHEGKPENNIIYAYSQSYLAFQSKKRVSCVGYIDKGFLPEKRVFKIEKSNA